MKKITKTTKKTAKVVKKTTAKKKESIDLFAHVSMLSEFPWKGDFKSLPANQTYKMEITYPLHHPATVKVKTGKSGMGLIGLLNTIGKTYGKIYQEEEEAAGVPEQSETMYNRRTTDGPHGIWGHDIGDLVIEGITIDHQSKKIGLFIGS